VKVLVAGGNGNCGSAVAGYLSERVFAVANAGDCARHDWDLTPDLEAPVPIAPIQHRVGFDRLSNSRADQTQIMPTALLSALFDTQLDSYGMR
jgi:nucleoside-diphosphate-sugar epimerase